MLHRVYFAGENHKKVLVTGGTGAIGSELVRYLKAQPDYDVVTLSSEAEGGRIDLKDKARLQELLRRQSFDYVYHLAALNPFQSNRGQDYFETNVQGTENLLAGLLSLKNQGKKMPQVFLASSALAYSPEKIPLSGFQETSPLEEKALNGTLANAHAEILKRKPADGQLATALLSAFHLSPHEIYYNDSKLLAEMTAQEYAQKGVPVKVGRLVNCYGPQSNQLMNQLVAEVKAGQAPTLVGKDNQARDYLYYAAGAGQDDVLRLVKTVAEQGQPGEAYNISSGGRFVRTPQAIARLAEGRPDGPHKTPSSKQAARVLLSNNKLLALGAAEPKTTPETGVGLLRAQAKLPPVKGFFYRVRYWFRQALARLKSWFRRVFGVRSAPKGLAADY